MLANPVIETLQKTANLPLVRIERENFLKDTFREYDSLLPQIIDNGAFKVGIPPCVIQEKALAVIEYEASKAGLISFATGIPGGIAVFGTVPADVLQFMAHALRIAQKLAFLSGMPKNYENNAQRNQDIHLFLLYLGVMFGSSVANIALLKLCRNIETAAIQTLSQSMLLQILGYEVFKNILQFVGVQLSKENFAKGISKVIPLLGGVAAGTLTFMSLKKMSLRLYRELAKGQQCQNLSLVATNERQLESKNLHCAI